MTSQNIEIVNEVKDLNPSAVIELFQLNLDVKNPASTEQVVYFHAGTNELKENITYGGVQYLALPVEATGFAINSSGSLSRPKFKLANGDGAFSALVNSSDDLIGCRVTRIRTFAKYIDAVNFPNGNPFANVNIRFPDEIWYIEQKLSENRFYIEWELVSVFDLNGLMLPRRLMLQNSCPYQYRGDDCGYVPGNMFDASDNPTSQQVLDSCGKRLKSCELRFGAKNVLPFGGFPGIVKYES